MKFLLEYVNLWRVSYAECQRTIGPIHLLEVVMFTLIRSTPLRKLLLEGVPSLGSSLVLAELFYKFHSFTLECIAFMATWFVLDVAINFLSNMQKTSSN